ncbi:6654_t:CDS:1, partial [Paraglomus occultum]
RKFRKEAASKAMLGTSNLATSEEKELNEAMTEDTKTLVTAIEVLKSEYSVSKSSSETYENEVKEFQDKVKAIIGNDLTN